MVTNYIELPKMAFAGFGARLCGLIVDALIFIFLFIAFSQVGSWLSLELAYVSPRLEAAQQTILQQQAFLWGTLWGQCAAMIIFSLYVMLMHKQRGATLGKIINKTRLIRLDGAPLTMKNVALRLSPLLLLFAMNIIINFIQYRAFKEVGFNPLAAAFSDTSAATGVFIDTIPLIALIWLIASAIWLFKDAYRRTPHDLLAKTAVIKV